MKPIDSDFPLSDFDWKYTTILKCGVCYKSIGYWVLYDFGGDILCNECYEKWKSERALETKSV
jgi:hypothetical protein